MKLKLPNLFSIAPKDAKIFDEMGESASFIKYNIERKIQTLFGEGTPVHALAKTVGNVLELCSKLGSPCDKVKEAVDDILSVVKHILASGVSQLPFTMTHDQFVLKQKAALMAMSHAYSAIPVYNYVQWLVRSMGVAVAHEEWKTLADLSVELSELAGNQTIWLSNMSKYVVRGGELEQFVPEFHAKYDPYDISSPLKHERPHAFKVSYR
jgi:hypothetical protein